MEEKIVQTERLPAGWCWHEYDDLSGSLHGPHGEDCFSYDCKPYFPDGVEYKVTHSSGWSIFWGTFPEFKRFAEAVVEENPNLKRGIL